MTDRAIDLSSGDEVDWLHLSARESMDEELEIFEINRRAYAILTEHKKGMHDQARHAGKGGGGTDEHGRTVGPSGLSTGYDFRSASGADRKAVENAFVNDYGTPRVSKLASNVGALLDEAEGGLLSKEEYAAAEAWYDDMGDLCEEIASDHGMDRLTGATVAAAFSPQASWHTNIEVMDKAFSVFTESRKVGEVKVSRGALEDAIKSAFKYHKEDGDGFKAGDVKIKKDGTPEMTITRKEYETLLAMKPGQKVSVRGLAPALEARLLPYKATSAGMPPITKAVKLMRAAEANGGKLDPEVANRLMSASKTSGYKVRTFADNLHSPKTSRGVTIDVHAMKGAGGRRDGKWGPMKGNPIGKKSGAATGYGAFQEAFRREAKKRGLRPHSAQAIAWVAQRRISGAESGFDKNPPQRLADFMSRRKR